MRIAIILLIFIATLKSEEKQNSFGILQQSQQHVSRPYYKDDRMVHLFLEEIKGGSENSIENNVCFNALDLTQRNISTIYVRFSHDNFIKLTESLINLQKIRDSDFRYKQNKKALISPSTDFSVSLTFEDQMKVFKVILGKGKIFYAEMNEDSFKFFVMSCTKVKDLIEKEK